MQPAAPRCVPWRQWRDRYRCAGEVEVAVGVAVDGLVVQQHLGRHGQAVPGEHDRTQPGRWVDTEEAVPVVPDHLPQGPDRAVGEQRTRGRIAEQPRDLPLCSLE